MSAITVVTEPAPAPSRLWEISYDGQCPTFHHSSHRAATALVDIVTRRQMKGWPDRNITVRLLDEYDESVWEATSDVAKALSASGWPGPGADRETTIGILEAVLVTDWSGEENAA